MINLVVHQHLHAERHGHVENVLKRRGQAKLSFIIYSPSCLSKPTVHAVFYGDTK